jgi:uncharacterized repeat protein (TIGR03803 family)
MASTTLTAGSLAALISALAAVPANAAPKETVIYNFTGQTDGGFPHAGLIADAAGNFYGTTTSGGAGTSGTVFMLTKKGKAWAETTLYAFAGGNDGAVPYANLVMDTAGALYGTTYAGGASGNGIAFKLTPPTTKKGAWTETLLHSFTGGNDGSEPAAPLILDTAGNVYGTTTGGGTGVVGTVFELSPTKNADKPWKETVLYNFTGNADGGEPIGGLLGGPNGVLYGTSSAYGTNNNGNIYQLTPPANGKGTWTETVLYSFTGGADGDRPLASLISDASGTLYGTTAGFSNDYGTVFSLTPPSGSGSWSLSTLYTVTGSAGFTGNGPNQALSMDSTGALYGTTFADGETAFGEVFKLTPPAEAGKHWKSKILYAFTGGADSGELYSNVLIGPKNTLYGTAYGSAGQSGYFPGIVWQIKN